MNQLVEFFLLLFDESGFPARWHCGNWSEQLGWLHVLSDLAIFLAYLAIPTVLGFFMWRRRDLPFPTVVWLFVAFICSCGFGHFVEAVIFWHPIYRFAGVLKFITATVSWITVGAMVYTIPRVLRLRSPEALEREVARRTADLAERARELEVANRELDEFASVASHDLRTPLEGVRALAGWILADNEGRLPPNSQKHLLQMQERVEGLGQMLEDLRQYSRAGRAQGDVTSVDVNAVVRDIEGLLAPAAGFEIVTPTPLPTFKTHRTPLQQVLQNLINNAIQHHDRDGGTITVSYLEHSNRYEFTVADDGPGIDAQFHELIFGLFERLRPSDPAEGSGVGLALVKKLVERHGGTVRVESGTQRGTSFSFTWPKLA